jgi:hypothetical protein
MNFVFVEGKEILASLSQMMTEIINFPFTIKHDDFLPFTKPLFKNRLVFYVKMNSKR